MNSKIELFFSNLNNTASRLLLLDYDGTLAPFREERHLAYPYDGIEERLNMLIASKGTKVIIVSGRAIKDLKPLLKLDKFPEIWGSHGWEHRDINGQYSLFNCSDFSLQELERFNKFLKDNGFGEYVEQKPVSLALHFRGVEPDKIVAIKDSVAHYISRISGDSGLVLSEFDGGMELKIPGLNKGSVVRGILESYPQDAAVAYLGDDLTDEDAFSALRDRKPSVLSVLVRITPRPSTADTWIKPPEEVLDFLDRWIEIECPY
jgi:trehalose 6-phosphate phosphatase